MIRAINVIIITNIINNNYKNGISNHNYFIVQLQFTVLSQISNIVCENKGSFYSYRDVLVLEIFFDFCLLLR